MKDFAIAPHWNHLAYWAMCDDDYQRYAEKLTITLIAAHAHSVWAIGLYSPLLLVRAIRTPGVEREGSSSVRLLSLVVTGVPGNKLNVLYPDQYPVKARATVASQVVAAAY